MWKLYKIIGKTSNDDTPVVTESVSILDRLTNEQFIECLRVMNVPTKNTMAVGLLFTESLIANQYFSFQDQIGKYGSS